MSAAGGKTSGLLATHGSSSPFAITGLAAGTGQR